CWSSTATVLPGREMIGLPMTFLRKGVRFVVASLWQVNDASSPAFVRQLYSAFPEGGCPEALAQTQRTWWEDEWKPSTWAGYMAFASGMEPRSRLAEWLLKASEYVRRLLGRSAEYPEGSKPKFPSP